MQRKNRFSMGVTLAAAILFLGSLSSASSQLESGFVKAVPKVTMEGNVVDGQALAYLDANGAPKQATRRFSEVLRGNGTRGGYTLSHGGIVPGSLRVSVDARTLKINADYFVDYANGMLGFMEPVRRGSSISATYLYVEGQDGVRSQLGMSGLSLNLRGTKLSFGTGVSTGANGLDFNTYGLAMTSAIGTGGTLSGLFYLSTPNSNVSNRVMETRASNSAPTRKPSASDAKSGHLILQNLNMKSGNATFRANYQDVGLAFNGFQAMRAAHAGNQEMLGLLGALEKERGVKRLGFGAGLQFSPTSTFGVDWDQITDGSDEIVKQGLQFKSTGLSFRYATQEVGEKFNGFQRLREGEAAQWARERGIKREDIALDLTPGAGTALGFSRSQIGDRSGSVERDEFKLGLKNLNLFMSSRQSSERFGRLTSLTDADKTALALDIRRQYNPQAAAAEVTAKDKEQIGLEAGLKRDVLGFTSNLGKGASVSYAVSSLRDGGEGVTRNSFGLTTQGLTFSYLDQRISDGFSRIARLSDFERGQLGNERGIRRTSLNLGLALSKTSAFQFSQLGLSDASAGMTRQSFAYNTQGLTARLNLASTDKGFSRARDLAGLNDADRNAIESERGFKRMDFTANLTAIKGLNLSTYTYSANNAADRLSRDIFRHNLVWTPNKSTVINYLTEGNSAAADGRVMNGVDHQRITFDQQARNGVKISAFRDVVTTVAGGTKNPSVTTDYLKYETDRAKPANLLAEARRIDFGNGKFENLTHLDLNYRAAKNLGLRFNRLAIDRGADPSSETNLVQWNWQASKTVTVNGLYSLTSTNNNTDSTVRSLGITAPIGNMFNFTGAYTEAATRNANYRRVADFTLATAKPFDLLGMKQTNLAVTYSGIQDKGSLQKEQVAAKITGMVGQNQVALEYGGNLNEKRQSAFARSFSFVSDRNEKLPLHFDLTYKARNVNNGSVQLVRRYNASFRMDQATKLNFSYVSLPEDGAGNMQPIKGTTFGLNRLINKQMNFTLNYSNNLNLAQRTRVNNFAAILKGQTDRFSAVQVGYSVDISNLNGQNTNAHNISFAFDRNIDANHSFGISTVYTIDAARAKNSVQANVEFKSRF